MRIHSLPQTLVFLLFPLLAFAQEQMLLPDLNMEAPLEAPYLVKNIYLAHAPEADEKIRIAYSIAKSFEDNPDPGMRFALAGFFASGSGVAIDYHTSQSLMLQAALQDHPLALAHMRHYYSQTRPYIQRARYWHQRLTEACDKLEDTKENAVYKQLPKISNFNMNASDSDIEWNEELASQGNPIGKYNLAQLALHGKLPNRDIRQALSYLHYAVSKKYYPAHLVLADIYLEGIAKQKDGTYLEKNSQKAYELYKEAADANFVPAQHRFAVTLAANRFETEKRDEALHYFQQAIDAGYTPASESLASFLITGNTLIPVDYQKAYSLLENLNTPNAYFSKGQLYSASDSPYYNLTTARSHFSKAANQGIAEAYSMIAESYSTDGNKTSPESIPWHQKAADLGNSKSELVYGLHLLEGGEQRFKKTDGDAYIKQQENQKRALHYLEASEKKGIAIADVLIGRSYYYGYGVERDFPKAIEHYRRGEAKNVPLALTLLAQAYEEGNGVERDLETALVYYRLSAEKGETNSRIRALSYQVLLPQSSPTETQDAMNELQELTSEDIQPQLKKRIEKTLITSLYFGINQTANKTTALERANAPTMADSMFTAFLNGLSKLEKKSTRKEGIQLLTTASEKHNDWATLELAYQYKEAKLLKRDKNKAIEYMEQYLSEREELPEDIQPLIAASSENAKLELIEPTRALSLNQLSVPADFYQTYRKILPGQ